MTIEIETTAALVAALLISNAVGFRRQIGVIAQPTVLMTHQLPGTRAVEKMAIVAVEVGGALVETSTVSGLHHRHLESTRVVRRMHPATISPSWLVMIRNSAKERSKVILD